MRTFHAKVIALFLVLSTMLVASPVSAQASYTSPTFGFSVTLPAGWTVDSETSDADGDILRFSNESVVAFLTSYATDQTPTACIEEGVDEVERRANHANFTFVEPIAEQNGKATALFGYTFVTAAGEQLDGRDRMTCWALPEVGGMVRLEFLLLERDLVGQDAAMTATEAAVESALAPLTAGESSGVEAATPIAVEEPDAEEAAPGSTTATPVPDIGTAPLPEVQAGVSGNSYVSPAFGYGLTWSDAWTVSSQESDNRGDYLGLEHADGLFADLIGEAYPQDTGSCFDFIAAYYSNHEDYINVVPNRDATSAVPGVWDATGTLSMTGITSSGTQIEIVNYLSCSHIPGDSAIVSLEISSLATSFEQLRPEMDALRQGFTLTAGSGAPAGVTPTAETASGTTTGAGVASGVSGMSYLSPNFGYRLSWDVPWTVDSESTVAGRDYLALTNGPVYAELLSESWDATQGNCFEWIVAFYSTNPDFTDVRAAQDAVSAVPGVWDVTGAIALTDADAATNGERINYVACSEIPGQGVVVSLEQFVLPIDAPGQLSAMDALRASFSMT
ncbi:MAG: hypothetical protein IT335_00720 [Thermomicrobiales bacterium]|nr:hypothetical protein [Thermomicrobiales bacterium]